MYGSFIEAARRTLDYEGIGKFVLLLADYALKGEDVHSEDCVIDALLTMAKPNIKAATDRYNKSVKGGEHGWKGGSSGIRGGRPRKGETPEEAYERRRVLWDTTIQEQKQAEEPNTAEKPPQNPLNDNVNANVNVNEKDNDYVNVYGNVEDKDNAYVNEKVEGNVNVKEEDNVKENVDEKRSFTDSLILNDFDDEEDYSYEEGSMSDYIHSKYLEEEEKKYRYSQSLEEDKETYI